MTSAADLLFIDTNVLVYASWGAAPLHQHARDTLAAHRCTGTSLCISRQVIREWLATLNRPRTGLALANLIAEAQTFDAHFAILDDTAATTASLLALPPQASGVRVHDINIVATMQTAGIQRLVTNNPLDFAPLQRPDHRAAAGVRADHF
jgi:predicted nucleic acid-binding protein